MLPLYTSYKFIGIFIYFYYKPIIKYIDFKKRHEKKHLYENGFMILITIIFIKEWKAAIQIL